MSAPSDRAVALCRFHGEEPCTHCAEIQLALDQERAEALALYHDETGARLSLEEMLANARESGRAEERRRCAEIARAAAERWRPQQNLAHIACEQVARAIEGGAE